MVPDVFLAWPSNSYIRTHTLFKNSNFIMITFPNAKINLGLHILGCREDGFHNIETIMVPIPLCDSLEIIPDRKNGSGICDLEVLGNNIDGDISENLCYKAYRKLSVDFNLPSVKIRLLKNIPTGAGLGGGSADAAFTVRMLNRMFELNLSDDIMQSVCAELGSDCSFFIRNIPALASGKGDELTDANINVSNLKILLIMPDLHVSTQLAYQNCEIDSSRRGKLNDIIGGNFREWMEHMNNAFEKSVFALHPELKKIKETLYDLGAVYASMSGSGSAVYGLFGTRELGLGAFPGCRTFHGEFITH